uniref:Uncharacterized protein n=1 Tax=Lactuca sativa TaxID=4236 RepID=A0A9R1WTL2_LACSA|nr:hypothetical protein LSAT_V11C900481700 [Lactuca sativa]
MNCKIKMFYGNVGVIGLTRWIEKTESIIEISSLALRRVRSSSPTAHSQTQLCLGRMVVSRGDVTNRAGIVELDQERCRHLDLHQKVQRPHYPLPKFCDL